VSARTQPAPGGRKKVSVFPKAVSVFPKTVSVSRQAGISQELITSNPQQSEIVCGKIIGKSFGGLSFFSYLCRRIVASNGYLFTAEGRKPDGRHCGKRREALCFIL